MQKIIYSCYWYSTFSINLPPLPKPADDSDDEDFILHLNDNESSFRDWFSSTSDQRSYDSTLDDGTLDTTKINSNDNEAADAADDTTETNNASATNVDIIDQRSDITNEDDGCSIFNAPTYASQDDTSDSGSILNDEPANETDSDEDACGIDNGRNHTNDDNIGS